MSVPDSKETGTARDTQSKDGKEHSKGVLAVHSLPLGQTLGSAAVLSEDSGHSFPTGSLPWPVETQGSPTPACRAVAILTALPEAPLSKLGGGEARPLGSEHAPLHPAQPRTHWGLPGATLNCFPETSTRHDFRVTQVEQTSTAVLPGF